MRRKRLFHIVVEKVIPETQQDRYTDLPTLGSSAASS